MYPAAQFIKLNFEDMGNMQLCNALALHEEITKRLSGIEGKAYLFFDEIQEVMEWERCVNSLRMELDCDIYITGSNAKLLSSELATYLAGRYVEFVIYPFSYKEFLELYASISLRRRTRRCSQDIWRLAACLIWAIFDMMIHLHRSTCRIYSIRLSSKKS